MKAFTLLEILLSISIITILVGISLPIYQSLQKTNDLEVATNVTVQNLRRAQELARASDGDSTWGLKIQSGILTLFKGSSYALRDADFDEEFAISTNIVASGVSEIVYSKFYGLPNSTGTITFTSDSNTHNIVINAKGLLTY